MKQANKKYYVSDGSVGQQIVFWNVTEKKQQKVILRADMSDNEIQTLVRQGLSPDYFLESDGIRNTVSLVKIAKQAMAMNANISGKKRKKVKLNFQPAVVQAPTLSTEEVKEKAMFEKIKTLATKGFGGNMAKAFALKAKDAKAYTKADIEAVTKAFDLKGDIDKAAAHKALN